MSRKIRGENCVMFVRTEAEKKVLEHSREIRRQQEEIDSLKAQIEDMKKLIPNVEEEAKPKKKGSKASSEEE